MKIGYAAALGCVLVVASAAHAADAPVIAPAPAWVRPVALPPVPTDAAGADAPVRLLLSDQQVSLDRGAQTVYSQIAYRIQTPQGLPAGNIAFAWRPDTDTLTVHRLLIRRGATVIDVLASGQTFTVVRRETNLESATLDGVLTATLQPEGLQVGDIVDFSASITSADPVMKGHVEAMAGAWNDIPLARAHLRMTWPDTIAARLRGTAGLPAIEPVRSGGTTSAELSLDSLVPVVPPRGAPLRFRMGRLVELTDFASWADLSALMAPLYAAAAVLPADGPLRAELETIRAASPDARTRATAALALVQDRVRYVALQMGAGGLTPAGAATTWSRRYGDCKGKTALLIALLRALEIEAEPVLVNTTAGDGLDQRLPMVGLFDHVLVRATIAGKTYWLDGTRTGDTALDRIAVPALGWGLPVRASGAVLVPMMPAPLDLPATATTIRIDATAGLTAPAPTTVDTVFRGDDAIRLRMSLANLVGTARDTALREYWKGQYDFITVKTASATFDAKTGEQTLAMTGTAKMDWSGDGYETDGTHVGYRADFTREPGPAANAPFAVANPYFTQTRETILLPKGKGAFRIGSGTEVDETIAGIAYRRHATLKDDVYTVERTERSIASEFPASAAPAAQMRLRALALIAARVEKPRGYASTDADVGAALAEEPTTSAGYVSRAKLLVDAGKRAEALHDYDRAVALDPANVYAWSNRAISRVQQGDLTGAQGDIAKAEAIDRDFVQIAIARGMIADVENRPADAILAYTAALKSEPGNDYALYRRGIALAATGDMDRALADVDARAKGVPPTARTLVDRGNFQLDYARYDGAIADFDRAIALDPKYAMALADRAMARAHKRDLAGAERDLAAAAAIEPRNAVVYRTRGVIAAQRGAFKDAIAAYTTALEIEPGNGFAMARLLDAYEAAGDRNATLRYVDAVLKRDPGDISYHLVRARLLRGLHRSDEAFAQAAAVIDANPQKPAAYMTAALIAEQGGRNDAAVSFYDRAIALKPSARAYVYRASVRPKADVIARQADLAAALTLAPGDRGAIVALAELKREAGDLPGAIATFSDALVAAPGDATLRTERGVLYARSGDVARGEADLRAVRATLTNAMSRNNLCWAQATRGVMLAAALADCDAALADAPEEAGFLDSRGLVLLRLGRFDEATATYTRALARSPALAGSLFGRGVARARKGDSVGSKADIAAAELMNPSVRAEFAGYGVTP